ncbi:ArsR/SmtB family transcription factor [Roseobacter sinensis]|uniref:Helix-turn-helix domain-containing protein n=1 Tax=Roseobacter sinensis TaxID=2931391 RepID=A0ABT3BA33_9RHOB|nr:SRPBCC domain-containing protein [Roseobacter sp. WL0113]MCV3270431.1 helix-turn-helix domain-containing protein [Roseobacter sp. WL0113]
MDSIFKALADPTRRKLLDSLRAKPGQSLLDLQGQLEMSRFGVMKHLGVLEEANLIVTKKVGRFKHHYLNALPLQDAIDRWIDPYRVKPAARAALDLKSKLEGTTPMRDAKPDFMMQTFIRCTHDALWDALTDPEQMSAYHFLAARVVKQGDTYVYEHADGSRMLTCKTLEITPKSRIAATFEPGWDETLQPSRQVFLLVPEGDHMKLVIEHYDLTHPVVPGEGIHDGWARFASGLKSWLETGETVKFNDHAMAG